MHVIAIVLLVLVVALVFICSAMKNAGDVSEYQVVNKFLKAFVVSGMIYCIPYSVAIVSNQ